MKSRFIPIPIRFFGKLVVKDPLGLGFLLSAGLFALVFWQYKILANAETRAVFDESQNRQVSR